MNDAPERMWQAANRLAKWRTVLAGWQLGTRPSGDPECDAVRDLREALLLLRAEVSGLTALLVESGTVTHDRMAEVFTTEYDALAEQLSRRFPGARATDDGIAIDVEEFARTTARWRP